MRPLANLALTFLFCLSTISALSHPHWCKPKQACWPDHKAWSRLANQLTGKLVIPESPIFACRKNFKSKACKDELKLIKNPFYLQTAPGDAESQGYWHAWSYHNSVYAVEAIKTRDIVAAVDFAREHHLRLVIKGAGHDYLGRSNAADSLLIWTHYMQKLDYHSSFIPEDCGKQKGIPVITAGAGTIWLQAYQLAAKHNRLILGGGCTTVGAAGGFTLGGGFGNASKKFGTGAANLLQAKVVTADGKVLIANSCQNKNLFWALRGGGGSFGVVTQMTYRTYPLPSHLGVVTGKIKAKNASAYRKLLSYFLTFFYNNLDNEYSGGQVSFHADNTLNIDSESVDLDNNILNKSWAPFFKWMDSQPHLYSYKKFIIGQIPPKKRYDFYWNNKNAKDILLNTYPGVTQGLYWNKLNSGQVYNYFSAYDSIFVPEKMFSKENISLLADRFFKASRYMKKANTQMIFYMGKGLSHASSSAIRDTKKTSTNPKVYHATGLLSIWAINNRFYTKIKGNSPKDHAILINKEAQDVNKAMRIIKSAAPNAGTYVNETSYFDKNWQHDFWGVNYHRLLIIKNKYDPTGLFSCHHCVGSDY